jgi:glutamate racemase
MASLQRQSFNNQANPSVTAVEAPIGVFDSGLGGLSVMQQVRALLPAEDFVYFADSAHCPYGTKTPEQIQQRCYTITEELVERGVKLLILACNTACAVALPELRERFSVPIVGLEPAVKPAATLSQTRRIAVLATPRTVVSDRLANLIRNHAGTVLVQTVPAPGLVDLVESGKTDGPEVEAVLKPILAPLLTWGIDVIVLGCTHYPFLRSAIERITGTNVRIVDSGEAIARRVQDVLITIGERRNGFPRSGTLSLLTSGDATQVGRICSSLLGFDVEAGSVAV